MFNAHLPLFGSLDGMDSRYAGETLTLRRGGCSAAVFIGASVACDLTLDPSPEGEGGPFGGSGACRVRCAHRSTIPARTARPTGRPWGETPPFSFRRRPGDEVAGHGGFMGGMRGRPPPCHAFVTPGLGKTPSGYKLARF